MSARSEAQRGWRAEVVVREHVVLLRRGAIVLDRLRLILRHAESGIVHLC